MTATQEKHFRPPAPYLPMPEVVRTEYPFLAIGDLSVVAGRLDPRLRHHPSLERSQATLLDIQKDAAPIGSSFYYVEHEKMLGDVEDLVRRILRERSTQKWGIINLDRYIFQGEVDRDFFMLNLSRGADNKLVERPGSSKSVETQLADMSSWLGVREYDGLLLVDDIVAFATTFPPIIQQLRSVRPVNIEVCAGICSSGGEWSGLEKLTQLQVPVHALTIAQASQPVGDATSGMAIPDSRDSTFFGGKIGVANSGRRYAFPYFFPFSVPTSSLMASEKKIDASERWLDFNIALLRDIESIIGRPLTIADLEQHGFGIPMTSIPELQTQLQEPDANTLLADHLSFATSLFRENRSLFEQLINQDASKKK